METTKEKRTSYETRTGKNERNIGTTDAYTPANIDCFIARYNAAKRFEANERDSCGASESD